MNPTFRYKVSHRSVPADPSAYLKPRLSFAFNSSFEKFKKSSPEDLDFGSKSLAICNRAVKLLKVQGVAARIAEFDERPVVQIDIDGTSKLNALARGIFKNHHGARIVFDPGGVVIERLMGGYDDEQNVLCAPLSLIGNALGLADDSTLGHELKHLHTATLIRNGVVTPLGIVTRLFAPILFGNSVVQGGDECRCSELDCRMALSRLGREGKGAPQYTRALNGVFESVANLKWESEVLMVRALRASRTFATNPLVVEISPNIEGKTVLASFLYLGSRGDIFEIAIPMNRSDSPIAMRAQLITQLRGLLTSARESYFTAAKLARLCEISPADTERPIFSRVLDRYVRELLVHLEKCEPIFLDQKAHETERVDIAQALLGDSNSSFTPDSALSVFKLFHQIDPFQPIAPFVKEIIRKAIETILSGKRLSVEARYYLAEQLLLIGEVARGRGILREIYDSGGRSNDVCNLLATAESKDGGNLNGAVRLGRELVQNAPRELCHHDTYAYALFRRGDLKAAEAAFRAARKLIRPENDVYCPESREFAGHFAEVLHAVGKHTEAIRWEALAAGAGLK